LIEIGLTLGEKLHIVGDADNDSMLFGGLQFCNCEHEIDLALHEIDKTKYSDLQNRNGHYGNHLLFFWSLLFVGKLQVYL
jgi:hypothetical protein